ncbi:MAG: TAXI family TRAP transporter solute-binding subunit [Desulfarculaceae bacterium]|jgi:TRAP transporter TAXI family solute receptor
MTAKGRVLAPLLAVFIAVAFFAGSAQESYSADTVNLKIAGARVKDPWYAFSQALAQFINKKSKWLRAEAVATSGLTANIELIREKPKEYIGLAPTSTTLHARPGHEWSKARKTYTGARFIANLTTMTQLLVTYDPKIKSIKDLKGKTVDVGRKGAGNTPDHLAILKAYGVLDDVKLLYTGFGGGAKRMMDGFCDATFLIVNHTYPHKFSKGRYIEQLETKKPVYYVGFDRDLLLKLRETEHGTVPVRIPAGALGKNQPKDLWGFNDPVYLMADKGMDSKIVNEVTRVIFETTPEEWAKWHPQGSHMTTQFKTATPVPKVVPAHDGTKAYYQKKGIKMTDLADQLK